MSEVSKIEQYVIDRVRELRLGANLSQVTLSLELGLSSKFVGNVESSKNSTKYNLNHLNRLAEILNCSVKDFLPELPIKSNEENFKL